MIQVMKIVLKMIQVKNLKNQLNIWIRKQERKWKRKENNKRNLKSNEWMKKYNEEDLIILKLNCLKKWNIKKNVQNKETMRTNWKINLKNIFHELNLVCNCIILNYSQMMVNKVKIIIYCKLLLKHYVLFGLLSSLQCSLMLMEISLIISWKIIFFQEHMSLVLFYKLLLSLLIILYLFLNLSKQKLFCIIFQLLCIMFSLYYSIHLQENKLVGLLSSVLLFSIYWKFVIGQSVHSKYVLVILLFHHSICYELDLHLYIICCSKFGILFHLYMKLKQFWIGYLQKHQLLTKIGYESKIYVISCSLINVPLKVKNQRTDQLEWKEQQWKK